MVVGNTCATRVASRNETTQIQATWRHCRGSIFRMMKAQGLESPFVVFPSFVSFGTRQGFYLDPGPWHFLASYCQCLPCKTGCAQGEDGPSGADMCLECVTGTRTDKGDPGACAYCATAWLPVAPTFGWLTGRLPRLHFPRPPHLLFLLVLCPRG